MRRTRTMRGALEGVDPAPPTDFAILISEDAVLTSFLLPASRPTHLEVVETITDKEWGLVRHITRRYRRTTLVAEGHPVYVLNEVEGCDLPTALRRQNFPLTA